MASTDSRTELDRSEGETRPRSDLRSLTEYAAVVVGGVLLALGWYGISGKAIVAQQIPYLASASIPGASLVVGGAVLIANGRTRRSNNRAADQVANLYELLTEAVTSDAAGTVSADTASGRARSGADLVSVSGGTRYHRPDCALVHGKAGVEPVDATEIAERDLMACPICEPVLPT